MLLLSGTACQTRIPAIEIPDMTLVRPTRPQLIGTYEDMVRTLIGYGYELEYYCDGLEDYISDINSII